MKRKIYSLAAVGAVAVLGAALFFFSPVFGFTQVKTATGTQTAGDRRACPCSSWPSTPTSGPCRTRSARWRRRCSRRRGDRRHRDRHPAGPADRLSLRLRFPSTRQQGNGGGDRSRTFRQSGLGSGIIVQQTGERYYVLTNNHVVNNASDISVKLNDQRVFKAARVGTDPRKDIALVSFDTRDAIPVADLGDSNSLQVGDIVFAVGNPLGYESTVTMGIVSALGRHGPQGDVASYTDYIQTDAAINQGNSGGALVNINGQVIGMNTWIAAPDAAGTSGWVSRSRSTTRGRRIQDFIAKGKVEYGWLGAQIADIQDTETYPGFAADLKLRRGEGRVRHGDVQGLPGGQGRGPSRVTTSRGWTTRRSPMHEPDTRSSAASQQGRRTPSRSYATVKRRASP